MFVSRLKASQAVIQDTAIQSKNGIRKFSSKNNDIVHFFGQFKKTWADLNTKPTALGNIVWKNDKSDDIKNHVENTMQKNPGKQGAFGFHCTVYHEDMLKQIKNSPDGELELRLNDCGEGLYIGCAETAAHFGGGHSVKYIFHVASDCFFSTNDAYGTNTTYLSGGGKVYVLSVYEINHDHLNFVKPWFWESALESAKAGVKLIEEGSYKATVDPQDLDSEDIPIEYL